MKINFIILCRLSSQRLPGKMLLPINKKPLLWYPLHALLQFADTENVIVATSSETSDDPIQQYCDNMKVQCFRGDLNNVAKRFGDCISKFECDYAVRICGDNVFVNHSYLKLFYEIMNLDECDFLSNTKGRTFPYGMSLEAVRSSVYLQELEKFENSKGDLEHVMPYFYRNKHIQKKYIFNEYKTEAKGIKLAIDEPRDVEIVERMLRKSNAPHYLLELDMLVDLYNQSLNPVR